MARLRAFAPLAVRLEDMLSYRRSFGIFGANSRLDQELAACQSTADYLGFASRFFPPTQIPSEIASLIDLANAGGVRNVCEIGTAQGGCTFLLMHAIQGVRLSIGIDLQVRNSSLLRRFAPEGCEFHAIDGSSYASATIGKVEAALAGRQFDLVLVDGDHRYDGVRADFLAYKPFVREGGFVAFHDIQPAGPEELASGTAIWSGGVPRFWRSTRESSGETWEFIDNPAQKGFGIGVLRISQPVG